MEKYSEQDSGDESSDVLSEENERTVYVGNYPADYNDEDMRSVFKGYDIERMTMLLKQNGHKAFGFFTLSTKEEAKRLVENMHDQLVDGRRIILRPSRKQSFNMQLKFDHPNGNPLVHSGESALNFEFVDYSKLPPLEPIPGLEHYCINEHVDIIKPDPEINLRSYTGRPQRNLPLKLENLKDPQKLIDFYGCPQNSLYVDCTKMPLKAALSILLRE